MRNKTLLRALFGLIIMSCSVNVAYAIFDEKPAPEEKFPGTVKQKKHAPPEYVPGEIIIKFKPDLGKEAEDLFKSKKSFSYVTGTDTLDNLNYKHKVKKAEKIFKHKDYEPESDLDNIYKFELEDSAEDILKAVEEYKRDPDVV